MTSPLRMPLLAFVIATGLFNAVAVTIAQEPPTRPALHEGVASDYADAEARLQAEEARLTASLDDAQKAAYAAARQKWVEYRDAAVALALAVLKPKPEQAEYFRLLELNKLTRDRIRGVERLSTAQK